MDLPHPKPGKNRVFLGQVSVTQKYDGGGGGGGGGAEKVVYKKKKEWSFLRVSAVFVAKNDGSEVSLIFPVLIPRNQL